MPAVSPDRTDENLAHEPPATDPVRQQLAKRPARPPPVRRASRLPPGRDEKKRSPLLVIVLVLVVLGVGGAVAWKKLNAGPSLPPADPHAGDVKAAQVAFQEGKNLVRRGQWKEATEQFKAAAEVAPQLEGLKGYVEAAKTEVPNQEHLDACAAALDKNQVAVAARELALVPDTTQQFGRRNDLRTRIGKVADARLVEARPLALQTKDKEKMRKLKALAEDVLAARPQDRDALAFLDTANRVLGAKEYVPPPPDPGDPSAEVISRYAAGDATGAFGKAEACAGANQRCQKLKEQISDVVALLKKVESMEENELERTVKLDRAISGGRQTPVGKPAGVRLAALLLPKASSAAARKQWGYAMSTAKKILEADPGNPNAQSIVSDGRQAASELFQRCYVGRVTTPDDSIPLCKEVVQMLPEGDELRGKAQRILDNAAPQ